MKKLFDKIFHSDNLAVNCIVRFILILLWWFRCYIFNMQFYMDPRTLPAITARPGYEYEYLVETTVLFFFPLMVFWFADAIWIRKTIKPLIIHVYEYNEHKKNLVTRYVLELIVPLIPFLIFCPIVYSLIPNSYMGKSAMVIQWLPIVMTGEFVSGIVLSVIGVLLLAVAFFIIPFYVFPPVFKFVRIVFAEAKFIALHTRYIDYARFTPVGIRFSFESNTPYSRKIKKIFKDFNEFFENSPDDEDLNKKIMCYIYSNVSENLPRKKGVYMTTESVFAVTECDFAKYKNDLDEDVILEEMLKALSETFDKIELKYPEFDAKERTRMLFKAADAFYPKDSGLKRL